MPPKYMGTDVSVQWCGWVCVSIFYALPVCLALPHLWTEAGSLHPTSSDPNRLKKTESENVWGKCLRYANSPVAVLLL